MTIVFIAKLAGYSIAAVNGNMRVLRIISPNWLECSHHAYRLVYYL